ncbi:MAG: glycosyltransferase [Candidatus Cloacimonetes bacterium]|nr:glycosyltransferase [Candidatus Cloacimonadota bacterium]
MNKPVRILHLASSMKRGGRERQIALLAGHNATGKLDHFVVYWKDSSGVTGYIDEYNLGSRSQRLPGGNHLRYVIELWRVCRRFKPNQIWAWGYVELLMAWAVGLLCGARVVNSTVRHGIRLKTKKHTRRMFLLHLSRYVVANSKAGLRANGLKRGHILYNGIEERFSVRLEDAARTQLRSELLGNTAEGPCLLSISNLVPFKDYITVMKALGKLQRAGYRFQYVVIGTGPMRTVIENCIVEQGLKDCVVLVGQTNRVPEYLRIADIFVHSSLGEGCSNAILEATMQGLPIVATRVGGIPETTSAKNALLFDYKDDEQLFCHLKTLLDNEQLCQEMGRESRRYGLSRFALQAMHTNYESIVYSIQRSERIPRLKECDEHGDSIHKGNPHC